MLYITETELVYFELTGLISKHVLHSVLTKNYFIYQKIVPTKDLS